MAVDPLPLDESYVPYPVYYENQRVNGIIYSVSGPGLERSLKRDASGLVQHFVVEEGDADTGESHILERSELSLGWMRRNYGEIVDQTFQFGIDAISSQYPLLGSCWVNLGQVHNISDSPCITMVLQDDTTLSIRTRTGTSGSWTQTIHYTDAEFQRGVWYNCRRRYRVDPDGTHGGGLLEVWLWPVGGFPTKVVNYSGNIGYANETQTYEKYGIYRSTSSPIRMGAWFANMRIDGTDKAWFLESPDPIAPGGTFVEMMKIDLLGLYGDAADTSSYSFNGISLGAQRGDRIITIGLAYGSTAAQDITSVTIQPRDDSGSPIGSPIPFSLYYKATTSASTSRTMVGVAAVPSGITGDVVVTANGPLLRFAIGVFRGQCCTANVVLGSGGGIYSYSDTSIPLDGLALPGKPGLCWGISRIGTSGSVATWTGLTKAGLDLTIESMTVSAAVAKFVQGGSASPASVTWSTGTAGPRVSLGALG